MCGLVAISLLVPAPAVGQPTSAPILPWSSSADLSSGVPRPNTDFLAIPLARDHSVGLTADSAGGKSEYVANRGRLYRDMNRDNLINNFDLRAVTLALPDPTAYAATCLDCLVTNADVAADGFVNSFHILPFVCLLVE
jgi:hypothetical protein